ncbi:MAG: hypothetical protein ACEQSU_12600 [Microgenomates group bacterium]
MRIAYHLGAHFTDEERLLRCLLKNRDLLSKQGVAVPGPKRYRNLLRDTAVELKGTAASTDTQAIILDQIMEEGSAERLILSWDSFLSLPPWVLKNTLYPAAGERVRAFSQIFPDIEAEFFLAIRNPASFLPALYQRMGSPNYAEFLAGADLFDLNWTDVIDRILTANPDANLTVWCDEDTPLIWPEILRAVTGLPRETVFAGEQDLLSSIMSPEGMTRLEDYLDNRPNQSIEQRRKIVAAFLDKFALPEKVEVEVEMPGWTEDMVQELSENYADDVAIIAQMSEITFLAP